MWIEWVKWVGSGRGLFGGGCRGMCDNGEGIWKLCRVGRWSGGL